MGKRIVRGTLTVGTTVSNVANMEYTDAYEYDRSKADEEYSGTPILISRGGSGSIELLAGTITKGHQANNWVFTYNEKELVNGVEANVTKTVTFTGVTSNNGASIPMEGRGSVRIAFDYSTSTEA